MPAENSAVRQATFASLGVPASLVAVLDDDGITTPFPIQEATLPDALAGRDILGRAQTGSGKTLGFALPLVARLAGGRTAAGRPRGLVLVPTRELANQVNEVLRPLTKAMRLWVTTIYGGVSQGPQVNALQRRTDIVVATPGRLADLIGQGYCDLSDVEITVIDEADQMADLGFLPVVRRLLEATPSDGQRLLFSATLDSAIDVLARRFLTDPARHSVDENSSPAEIEHYVLTVAPGNRVEVIAALAGGDKRSLVFTRTKHGAERLARQLTAAGIPAAELHGNLRQGARSRNLAAFSSGAVRVMVATDIAARGIHVDGIDLVIHADPPAEHKAYAHRSGRTARAGADGVVVTMQTPAQAREVRDLMRKAGVTPQVAEADSDSAVVREIAGPPAPRVKLLNRAADLVQPADRLSEQPAAWQPGAGRPGRGKPRQRPARADGAGRSSRAQHRPADRTGRTGRQSGNEPRYGQHDRAERGPDDSGDRSFGQPVRQLHARGDQPSENRGQRTSERPAGQFGNRSDRPAPQSGDRGERPTRRFDDRNGRPVRRFDDRDGRPARQFDDRGERSGRGFDDRGERSGREWAPAGRSSRGTDGRSWRGNGAGAEAGSRRGGAGDRSGYAGQRTAGGDRRNSGQGRHS
jgi:superfamily II DNA/RNA helicase